MSTSEQPAALDFKRRSLAVAARTLIRVLGWTYRPRVVRGAEVLEGLVESGRPAILCFWHEGIFFFASFLPPISYRGVPMTVFTSRSRDGELVARLALAWGAEAVRGSSSRGGSEALRQLLRGIRRGRSPIIIPDGPRGPRRQAKPGAVVLARMAGCPCVALACAAPGWRLSTWDRLLVPRPFARVAVAVERLEVPADDGDSESWRGRLERTLEALRNEAERAAGPRAEPV